MTDNSFQGKECCPEAICGDKCRRLTDEEKLKDKDCHVTPPDKCKYAYKVA